MQSRVIVALFLFSLLSACAYCQEQNATIVNSQNVQKASAQVDGGRVTLSPDEERNVFLGRAGAFSYTARRLRHSAQSSCDQDLPLSSWSEVSTNVYELNLAECLQNAKLRMTFNLTGAAAGTSLNGKQLPPYAVNMGLAIVGVPATFPTGNVAIEALIGLPSTALASDARSTGTLASPDNRRVLEISDEGTTLNIYQESTSNVGAVSSTNSVVGTYADTSGVSYETIYVAVAPSTALVTADVTLVLSVGPADPTSEDDDDDDDTDVVAAVGAMAGAFGIAFIALAVLLVLVAAAVLLLCFTVAVILVVVAVVYLVIAVIDFRSKANQPFQGQTMEVFLDEDDDYESDDESDDDQSSVSSGLVPSSESEELSESDVGDESFSSESDL